MLRVARYPRSARKLLAKRRMGYPKRTDPNAMPGVDLRIATYLTKNATLYYNEFMRRLRENLETIGSYNAEILQATP